MTTDSNQEIDKRFHVSHQKQSEINKQELTALGRELDLNSLSYDERIIKLEEEKRRSHKEMAGFKWQHYLAYAGDKEALRVVFRNRCIFYHDHEEEKMQKALSLYEKDKYIDLLIKETQALMPAFTMVNYLRSDYNIVFYRLHQQPLGTTREEYEKMISCQERSLSECVFSLSLQFREKFFRITKTDEPYLDKAKKELKQVRKLLDQNNPLAPACLFTLLAKLKAMDGWVLTENKEKLYNSFVACLADPSHVSRLTPRDFKQCLQTIHAGQVPDGSLLCIALKRYEGWLNELVYGLISINDHPEIRYDRLFDQLLKESIEKGMRMVDQIKEQYPSHCMTAEEYEKVILGKVRHLKSQADQLRIMEYYRYKDDLTMVKHCFVNNCLHSRDVDFQSEQLRNTIIFQVVYSFLEHELLSIGKGIKAAVEDILRLNSNLAMVIAYMIPNQQIVARTNAVFEKAMKALHNRKPLIYVLEDLDTDFNFIFEEAEENLLNFLEEQPYDERLAYADRGFYDINLKEYKAHTRGLSFHEFYTRLKTLFKFQVNYLTHLPQNSLAALDADNHLPPIHETDLLSFGFKGNENWLVSVYTKINKRYHFLDPRTPVETFVRVMTSKNLNEETEPVYIACHSNIFKCIMDASKPYFENLTYVNIGRSQLFISHLGHTFTNGCLKGSKLKDQGMVREIKYFFV